jgi:hypothetical protein
MVNREYCAILDWREFAGKEELLFERSCLRPRNYRKVSEFELKQRNKTLTIECSVIIAVSDYERRVSGGFPSVGGPFRRSTVHIWLVLDKLITVAIRETYLASKSAVTKSIGALIDSLLSGSTEYVHAEQYMRVSQAADRPILNVSSYTKIISIEEGRFSRERRKVTFEPSSNDFWKPAKVLLAKST